MFVVVFIYLDVFYGVFGRGPLLKLDGSPNGPLFSEKGSPFF